MQEDIVFVDDWGVTHTFSPEGAKDMLRDYINAWPCGLDEIESAINEWKHEAEKYRDVLLQIEVLASDGVQKA